MAAQRLAEAGHAVTVYDAQATVGRKFLVAGHGGFNFSNHEPLPAFAARYGAQQADFARYLALFSPQHLRQWLADLGISTFVGTSGRIFPTPEHKPAQVLRAWLARLGALGVQVRTRHRWLGFEGERGLRLRDEVTGQLLQVQPAATVLALGGASWAKTGSDGQWVPLLTALGVHCVPFAPANCGVEVPTGSDGQWVPLLTALGVHCVPFAPANCGVEVPWSGFFREKVGRAPLKNIALTCQNQRVRGELLLTDYGVEGTPVYALTPAVRAALASPEPAFLYLNLKPDLSAEQLLSKLRTPRGGRSLASFLTQTLRLGAPVPTLLREVAPPAATATPEALAQLLQCVPLPLAGLRPLDEAISTAGGVAWGEITPDLMLHRRPGTFVAGEMLDWEASTGGYLLQGCLSSGAWVAESIKNYVPKTIDE